MACSFHTLKQVPFSDLYYLTKTLSHRARGHEFGLQFHAHGYPWQVLETEFQTTDAEQRIAKIVETVHAHNPTVLDTLQVLSDLGMTDLASEMKQRWSKPCISTIVYLPM